MSDNTFKFQQQSKKSSSYHAFIFTLKTNPSPPYLVIVFIIEASVSILCLSHVKNRTVEPDKLRSTSECEEHFEVFVQSSGCCL